jgi:hypothetical protein
MMVALGRLPSPAGRHALPRAPVSQPVRTRAGRDVNAFVWHGVARGALKNIPPSATGVVSLRHYVTNVV